MPTLGNGHLSCTLLQRNVFVNGIYNGERGESHRARVPNFANIYVEYCENAIDECEYTMDIRNGVFSMHLETPEFDVEHKLFFHRVFDRVIVNLVKVTRKSDTGKLM